MKKALSILLATLLLLTGIPLGAVSVSATTNYDVQDHYIYSVSDGKATIVKYAGSETLLVVPSTLGGYPVVAIGDSAFSFCGSLSSVDLGKGVTTIDRYAFEGCVSLRSLTIPDQVQTIGYGAFRSCQNLESVYVGSGVTKIDGAAFDECNKISSVYISDLAAWCSIEYCADVFGYIGRSSPMKYETNLYLNGELVKDVVIPEGATKITDYAFCGCENITSVVIPDSVEEIGMYAFWGCTAITTIHIPDKVTSIGDYAFLGCTELKDLYIGESVQVIGEGAFEDCSELTFLYIPDSVTKIDSYAFDHCVSLHSLSIGTDIEAFGGERSFLDDLSGVPLSNFANTAFNGCNSLAYVFYRGPESRIGVDFDFNKFEFDIEFESGPPLNYLIDEEMVMATWVFDTKVETVKPTCNTDGSRSYSGHYKDGIYEEPIDIAQVIPATNNHKYDNYCDVDCSDCGFVRDDAHRYTPATCTMPKKCMDCGIVNGEPLPHDCITEYTWPNCIHGGYTTYTCVDCGKIYTDNHTEALGHTWFEATCTTEKICAVCREIGGPALGHDYQEERRPATCERDGYSIFRCSRCSEMYETTEKALGHTWQEATCEVSKYCTRCNLTDGEPLGHDPIYGKYCDEPTTCTRCDISGGAKPHKLRLEQVPADCVNGGYTKVYCAECEYFEEYWPSARGHNEYGVVTRLPSCKETGITTFFCIDCGEELRTETIAKEAHTYEDATCTKAKTCTVCGATSGKALGHKYTNACDTSCNTCKAARSVPHSYKTVTKKATTTANGYTVKRCSVCDKETGKKTLYKVSSVTLSKTSYTYNGKVQKPTVTVKNANGVKLTEGTSYTVTYSTGCKSAGTYKVTIKLKGNYSGTVTKIFKINPVDVSKCKITLSATSYTYNGAVKKPTVTVKNAAGTKLTEGGSYTVTYATGRKNVGTYKVTIKMKGNYTGTKTITFKILPTKTSISSLTAGSKKLTVKWAKKTTQVTGYEIQYSTSKTFASSVKTKTITKNSTVSTSLTGLSAKKTYYVRIRTYKTVNGVKIYSGWSTVKSLKTK